MVPSRPVLASLLVALSFPLFLQASAFGAQDAVPYRPPTSISLPTVVKEVKPQYTQKAKDAKIEGSVWLECVVTPKGVCSKIKVVRSLDSVFGLDKEAIKAVRQWRFIPAKKQNQPVPMSVTIEMRFWLPK